MPLLTRPRRLHALDVSGLLSSAPDRAVDRVVRLARRALGAPTVLVSLVEPHRQVFKGAVGLAEPWASCGETPISHSFCRHVVDGDRPLVVEDARIDERVADNPAVEALGVVAYLGVPFRAPDGETLGALCAIDGAPRAWTDDDRETLADLADLLTDELGGRERKQLADRVVDDRDRHAVLLDKALQAAPMILFAFDAGGTITLSRGQALAEVGLAEGETVGVPVWAFNEPGSEGARALARVLGGERARWTDDFAGQTFETTAWPSHDGGGVAVAVLVTDRVAAERRAEAQTRNLRRLLRATSTQGTFVERAGAVLRETAEMLGLEAGLLARVSDDTYTCLAAVTGRGETLAPGDERPLAETYCALAFEAGDLVVIEHMATCEHRDHACYQAVGLEAYVGVPVVVDGEAYGALSFSSARPAPRPFTEADRELVRLAGQWAGALLERERREQEARAQVERLAVLADAFALRTPDDTGALADVLERLCGLLGLDIGIVSQIDATGGRYEVVACATPDGVAMAPGDAFELGQTYCSLTLAREGVLSVDHMEVSEHRRHPCYGAFGLEAYVGAPVTVEGEVYGTVNFSSVSPRAVPFTEADRDLVRLAARWVGGLIETAQEMTRRAKAEREAQERGAELALVQSAIPDAVVFADADRRVLRVNPAFSDLFGYAPADVLGQETAMLYAAPEAFAKAGAERFNAEAPAQLDPYPVEYRRHDGTTFTGETVGSPVRDAAGRVLGYVGLIRDVTARLAVEREVREQKALFRLLAENTVDLVCLHAPDGTYDWVSPSAESLLGYAPEALVGLNPYDLFHPDDADRIRTESHEAALRGETSDLLMTYRIRHRDGHYLWLETLTQPILDDDGVVVRLQTASRNVTERRAMEDRLYHQAHHDDLTGLPNRALFTARLDTAVEAAGSFAVLFVDLDRFKTVNDTLGHSAGDRLLQAVAGRLRGAIREQDTVARLGGDEFAVLLDGLPGDGAAAFVEGVAERIRDALGAPVRLDGRTLATHGSVGVVLGRPDHASSDAVLREADQAMYQAKGRGGDRAAVYSPDDFRPTHDRLRLEVDLQHAVDRDELRLVYQPIVRLDDGGLAGFEALVRWAHPELGVLSPAAFIGMAEESGLVAAIDRWVLAEAARQAAAWAADEHVPSVPPISVNCTGRDLLDAAYVGEIDALLAGRGPGEGWLSFEITEGLLIEDEAGVAAQLGRLQRQGVRFALDDFGTGYASLSTLHALPIDTIKVDRSFVMDLDSRDESRTLVETIVGLGHLLTKSVVAEGIEAPAHLDLLRRMGCPFGQGYLFSAPVGPMDASALLRVEALPWASHWGPGAGAPALAVAGS